ncbi:hypothetical protein ACTWPT_13505 [Nonomuraea sp. 3N208]|uniref:hypothetical protein n=1 Tax=Nonomuraea sp. 3N208 TaxID=3457421 RepID=UPI003FCE0906
MSFRRRILATLIAALPILTAGAAPSYATPTHAASLGGAWQVTTRGEWGPHYIGRDGQTTAGIVGRSFTQNVKIGRGGPPSIKCTTSRVKLGRIPLRLPDDCTLKEKPGNFGYIVVTYVAFGLRPAPGYCAKAQFQITHWDDSVERTGVYSTCDSTRTTWWTFGYKRVSSIKVAVVNS